MYVKSIAKLTDLNPLHVETVMIETYRTLDSLTRETFRAFVAKVEQIEAANPGWLKAFHISVCGEPTEEQIEAEAREATERLIAVNIDRRTQAGLVVDFVIPGRSEPFTCYPKDNEQKARWIALAPKKGWTVLHGPDPDVNITKLAIAFASDVCGSLTKDQLAEVIRLNETDGDSMICHTHDFYDANESMIAAFEQVFGREIDPADAGDAALINGAWSLAKVNGFDGSRL